jgi:hypothetical protein
MKKMTFKARNTLNDTEMSVVIDFDTWSVNEMFGILRAQSIPGVNGSDLSFNYN